MSWFRKIIDKLRSRLVGGAALLSLLTLGSYITGLMRDRIFAHTFGAGRELDIYNTAFIIPDLLLVTFVASALSPAFIPLFSGLNAQEKKKEADEFASSVIISAVGIMLILGILAALLMPFLSGVVAPGFDEAERALLTKMSRLLLLSPLIIALSTAVGSMLVSYKSFLSYGLSPIFYNAGIIGGTYLVPSFGLYGLIIGTLGGALLHLAPRLISIARTPFNFSWKLKIKEHNFHTMLRLMLPKMLGHPVEQLKFLGFTRVATLLTAGSVTSISFARNFQSVPVSLFGIATSVAAFPLLAEYAAKNDRTAYLETFFKALRTILYLTIPSAIGLYLLSELPIRIFLGGGNFTETDIIRTGSVLAIFSLAIPTEGLLHLLARSFYALKNTLIPVTMRLVGLGISLGFAYTQYGTMGIVAVPYGFVLGSIFEVGGLSLILRRHLATSGGELSYDHARLNPPAKPIPEEQAPAEADATTPEGYGGHQ